MTFLGDGGRLSEPITLVIRTGFGLESSSRPCDMGVFGAARAGFAGFVLWGVLSMDDRDLFFQDSWPRAGRGFRTGRPHYVRLG